MASNKGNSFKRSKARTKSGNDRCPISVETPAAAEERPNLHRDRKRAVLDVELNGGLTDQEDDDFEFPAAKNRVEFQVSNKERRPKAVGKGIKNEKKREVYRGSVNESNNRIGVLADQTKGKEITVEIDSDAEKELRKRWRRWEALLETARIAVIEHEENEINKQREIQTRREKQRQDKTAEEVAPSPPTRLTRARGAPFPKKYGDSILDFEAETAIIATKLKNSK